MSNIDPYATTNAMARGYEFAGRMQEDRARRQAGNALAGGDMTGAMTALGNVGAVEDVAALQAGETRRQAAEQERAQAEQEQIREFMLRGTTAMRAAPAQMRDQVYQQLRPTLAQIYPPEILAQMDASPKDDATLDSLITALGGESTTYNTRNAIVRVGPAGQVTPVYEVPEDPLERELLEARIAATRAQVSQRDASADAARARAARSGGGSRRTGGGSRQAAPAAPSRRPWERF